MKFIIFIFLGILFIACSSSSKDTETESYIIDEAIIESNINICGIEDGSYSASVDYNNPETGYSQSYDLTVEVQNCQVIQIDFSNGGRLDEDHISPGEIDDSGHASIEGEDGKTYEVQIYK